MCGIAGKLDFAGAVDPRLIERMCAAIEHRGPDSRGTFVNEGVGLGIQRLAIIDVAGGEQPIFNEDRSVVVVMNGEIYNFPELRERLLGRGHRFSSHSDTEVLVHLYEDYGGRMVHELRGMFAFAIWDARRQRLFCARDRVGKKPLFWSRQGSRFWFASEIGALLEDPEIDRAVDHDALAAYLALQYVPHPFSAFSAIRKLPPASTLTVDAAGERIERYWALDYSRKLEPAPVDELEERVRAELREATRIRLMSEVPLGAFLSGGIDSSAVVAAMAEQLSEPVKTFSVGFSEADFDELRYARLVSERFGTDHHEFVVEPQALEIMPKLARHYGEPFADEAAIPSFYLAELTRRHVTVALNGDGGDESFAGYSRYAADDRIKVLPLDWVPVPLLRAASTLQVIGDGRSEGGVRTRVSTLARILGASPAERYARRMSTFDLYRQRRLLTRQFAAEITLPRPEQPLLDAWSASSAQDRVERMMETDVEVYLPGALLTKVDIASMAHSVEARSPLLDHKLMEFAASLPVHHKRVGTEGKLLFKSALRGWVPDEILDRRKQGFSVPLDQWFRGELRALPGDVLLDRRSLERGYFDRLAIERLIAEHQQGLADHGRRLWVLLQLELWHREVVEAPRNPSPSVAAAAE